MKRSSTSAAALALVIGLLPAAHAGQQAPLPIRPQSLTIEQYNALVAIEQSPENILIGDIRAGYRDEHVQFADDALSIGFLVSLAVTILAIVIIQGLSL